MIFFESLKKIIDFIESNNLTYMIFGGIAFDLSKNCGYEMKNIKTKTEIESYLEKMNKLNQWEEKQNRNLTPDENMARFFALMEFGYQSYSKEQIESFREKKLASLIEINRKLNKIRRQVL